MCNVLHLNLNFDTYFMNHHFSKSCLTFMSLCFCLHTTSSVWSNFPSPLTVTSFCTLQHHLLQEAFPTPLNRSLLPSPHSYRQAYRIVHFRVYLSMSLWAPQVWEPCYPCVLRLHGTVIVSQLNKWISNLQKSAQSQTLFYLSCLYSKPKTQKTS